MKKVEKIIKVLNKLGGIGKYSEIYAVYEMIESVSLTDTGKASVRACIENHSSDSDNFKSQDIFYSVYGKGKGVWGLRDYQQPLDKISITQTQFKENYTAFEGRKQARTHIQRERNPYLVKLAKSNFADLHDGKLFCEICGFNFENEYGEVGSGFIEAHHRKPVSEMRENERTNVNDIMLLCSNCHRMIHRHRPWLKMPDILKNMIEMRRNND
jgi:putative restriction endonuclease